ncbi:hypothetical protein C6W10_02125 [Plantactinospora sp. BB1]|nr:hypothetical protein C6W10_02125 [Plantactinospora sp. BB1]
MPYPPPPKADRAIVVPPDPPPPTGVRAAAGPPDPPPPLPRARAVNSRFPLRTSAGIHETGRAGSPTPAQTHRAVR